MLSVINKVEEIANNNIEEVAERGGLMWEDNDEKDFLNGVSIASIGNALIEAYNLGYKEGKINKTYNVRVIERLQKTVTIEAEDEEEAMQKVEDMVNNGDVCLSFDDFTDRYFECVECMII